MWRQRERKRERAEISHHPFYLPNDFPGWFGARLKAAASKSILVSHMGVKELLAEKLSLIEKPKLVILNI